LEVAAYRRPPKGGEEAVVRAEDLEAELAAERNQLTATAAELAATIERAKKAEAELTSMRDETTLTHDRLEQSIECLGDQVVTAEVERDQARESFRISLAAIETCYAQAVIQSQAIDVISAPDSPCRLDEPPESRAAKTHWCVERNECKRPCDMALPHEYRRDCDCGKRCKEIGHHVKCEPVEKVKETP
jgi:hypothetical protein